MGNAEFSECWYKRVCGHECSHSCIRFLEMSYLVQESRLPEMYQYPVPLEPDEVDFSGFDRLADIKDGISEFVRLGRNLYIGGKSTGIGKTSWASKLMLRYFDAVWAGNGFRVRGLFLHVPTALLRFKDFENGMAEEERLNILNADLVVWDDIGSAGLSNYDFSQLSMYVDSRLLNGKTNVYTSNIVQSADLQRLIGPRLASRVWNTSEKVILHGKDKRAA